jgi:hypothetical protein
MHLVLQVKLQTQNTDAHSHKYRSAIHCTSHILKTEGVCMHALGTFSQFRVPEVVSSILSGNE